MQTLKIKLVLLLSFILLSSQGFIKTTVALTGNVFNEVTKVGETCNILVYDKDGNRASATRSIGSQNGYYYLPSLKPGEEYTVKLMKKGFMKELYKIQIPNSDKYVELSKDFQVKPLKKGIKIPFQIAPFELRKSKLRVGADIFLNPILDALVENKTVIVKLISYPDNSENTSFNSTLTNQRALAVKNWLVENGVNDSRISLEGNNSVDKMNPPPTKKSAKGKRYIGPMYYEIVSF
ncbi:OmpA family protein [Candidatus Kapabacteria bacterium]|nr:OmpA family protein [Candidatus Kapabacteria bacterium]